MKKYALILLGLYLGFWFAPSLMDSLTMFMVKHGYTSRDLNYLITFITTPIIVLVLSAGVITHLDAIFCKRQES